MRVVAFTFLVVTGALSSACAPLTSPCARDDECAHAVCVEGRCVDPSIGETAEPPEPPPPQPRPRELDSLAEHLGARRTLHARPLFRTPNQDPPINADDDDNELLSSCDEIFEEEPEAVSGFYRVRSAALPDGVVVECEMRSDGGWTIVADVRRDGCPPGWAASLLSGSCERPNLNTDQIASAFFPIPVDYRDIRGGARAWSTGNNRGFDVGLTYEGAEADELYVDGLALSVNAGGPGGDRQHLWTFAAASSDPYSFSACPSAPAGALPPDDVVGAYSCDARAGYAYDLWDGDAGDEDHGDFARVSAPKGDTIEARLMSPLLGVQSPVRITELFIAVR